jgi:peroxiredoxin
VNLKQLLGEGRSVLVGVVGAFAPERLQIHLTEVHTKAVELHRAGFTRLVCVAPNDPWTVKAWANVVDVERRLTFLCDGHLELGRWLGATFTTSKRRHLGPRPRSYLALVRAGVIERLTFDGVAAALMFDEAREQEPGVLAPLQASMGMRPAA